MKDAAIPKAVLLGGPQDGALLASPTGTIPNVVYVSPVPDDGDVLLGFSVDCFEVVHKRKPRRAVRYAYRGECHNGRHVYHHEVER